MSEVRSEICSETRSETQSLLDTVRGEDKAKGWAAVQLLVNMRPATDEEKKARAYACACVADAAFTRGKFGTAIDWWQEAVDDDPLNPQYRLQFVARGLLPAGMNRQSRNEVHRALNLDDKNPEAWRLLGNVQVALCNPGDAAAAFDKQIELAPTLPESYLDRIDLALECADWETVERLSKKILANPGRQKGNALHQLGLLAFRHGRHEEALRLWDETLTYQCDHPEVVAWNQGMALLALGRYRDGWRKHESRAFNTRELTMPPQMHRGMIERLWQNEPPPARLHVHQEMGFGDALAMARYVPLLLERGYEVCFEVMPELVELMRHSLPGVNVIPRAKLYPGLLGVPEFDYLVPALSLPRLFGTETNTIPWRGPYLKADPKKVAEYRSKLGGKRAIGLCWSAGVRTEQGLWIAEYGRRKSIPFENLIPLIEEADCPVISLQVGPPRKDGHGLVLDLLPVNPTWDDTAALVECLDLVITADTGLAHLVGGMGKPLWLMMHTEGSWHWMAERPNAPWNEKSPWYPSAKLFRANKPHQWSDVISKISAELYDRRRIHRACA